ncbi:AAA family ATPase [Methylovirgula sp. 4M-Z18]|uniref:AAA family ATPase n=1 Tax=Methylovirgula sp. 4M-Z18 TaxID=2293567 RepID=UPI000E2E5C1D|nr:AAA family ATPase [Methylovirgula sp. 4M-Z18]RFB76614.1 hypothetical protein DYH55_19295 [Methylovirgula sp. 4M-Z18]
MRLRRLDLTRYGKFTNYSIDFNEHISGTPDLHIIYGLNEAGKSTSLSAYLDLLFGIEDRTKYGFLHQGKAMEIGACLEFDGRAHEFKRLKQRSNSLLGAHGQPVNEAILSVPLAGLTRDAYRMMFSLDDQTLEDGGNAILESKGDLGELLFSASAGLAGISSILETSVAEADGIFRKRASSTKIAGLKRQIAELKSQRDAIDIQASTHRALTTALEQVEAKYNAAMKEIGAARARQEEIARVLRAHPLATEYRLREEQLAAYKDLPHPPHEWLSVLPDLMVQETRLQAELAGIQQREHKIREEMKGLVTDEHLLTMTERLDHLADSAARYATAEEDLPKRKAALSESIRRIDMILAALGQADIPDPKSLLIPAATIGTLRDLIGKKSGIDVARQSAEKEHDATRQALAKEQHARQALGTQGASLDAGKVAQLQSVLSHLRDGNFVAEFRFAERSIPANRQAFDDAASELHPWTGDGDALRRILPPAADRLETWKLMLNGLDRRRLQAAERNRELATRHEQSAARLAALRDTANIMDDEEAQAALLQRDEAWQRHLSTLDRETADRFETHMRNTDAVAAARLDRAKELEELRSLATELAVIKVNGDRQRELLREADEELETLRREIKSETPLEIPLCDGASLGSWLLTIGRWTENRTSALAAWDKLRRVLRELDEAKAALAAKQNSLAKTLITVGIHVDGLDLAALMQAADNVLADHAALLIKQIEVDKRLDESKAATVQRKVALDEAVTAFDVWQRDWTDALVTTWFAEQQGTVGVVREILDVVADLPEALRERDDLQHRIDSMEANQKAFADMIMQLHEALGETFDGKSPLAAAKILIRRRDDAMQIEAKRRERDQALVDLAMERDRQAGETAIHDAQKRDMTDFLRVETLADVRQVLERCRKRDELVQQQGKLERQIISDMPSRSAQDALIRLIDIDLSELQREQAELVTRVDALDGHAKNLFADRARANDSLTAIGGDDAVARLEASRRTSLLEIEDLALRYLRLRSGSLVADHGIRAYRDKHRSAMMSRASEAFRLITRDEYTGLATRPDKDREVLIGLSRNGGSKVAVELSKGTQFQLYLALRVAGYEEFAAVRPSVPFVADDIMETFDEPRSEEVFRLLGQMAQVGQVIYLTHHRHLCEIAADTVPLAKIHEIT